VWWGDMKDKACQREKLRCIQKESISGSKALLSKVIIIAFIYILLFDPTIGSAAIQYDAGAWDTTQNRYEKANIKSYAEWDCIPVYFEVKNTGNEAVTETTKWEFDHSKEGYTGFLGFNCCGCTQCLPSDPLGCCLIDSGADISTCESPGNGTWELVLE